MATKAEISSFIKLLGGLAVAECNRRISQGKGFVLPSVCIAQSALETGYGTAGLMTKANAFFGIKAGGSWTGAVYRADTWEVANGVAYNTKANFRAYSSLEESVTDYYDLIGNASRYSKALSYGTDKSQWKTAKECITAIWAGGYATDDLYVEKIMNMITPRNLTTYDDLIDGVSFEGSVPSFGSFSKGDFLKGSLYVSDSGRSISNDTSADGVALDFSKAFEGTSNGTLRITHNLENDPIIIVARLIGDTGSLDETEYKNGDTVTFTEGEKIGFYFPQIASLDDLPANFSFALNNPVFDGDESYQGAIAFFVKIE